MGCCSACVFNGNIRIWSPGLLPYGVTLEDLHRRTHTSKPRNRLIAQVFYDLEIIERYGSGIHRMLDACKAAGLPEPTLGESTGGFLITFRKATTPVAMVVGRQPESRPESQPESTGQVTGQVAFRVLRLCEIPRKASEVQSAMGIRHRQTFRENYLAPLLQTGWIERTIPDKPNSRLQRYRLTDKGRTQLRVLSENGGK